MYNKINILVCLTASEVILGEYRKVHDIVVYIGG